MTTEEDYVERLEKIIDKQDNLLSQLDAKFNQQDTLNEYLVKQNKYLEEDIQKHKNLTRDMNKTVTQQKKVVEKLKEELEEQLKIQQELHKDYGEVIKQLTDDLEEEQEKNKKLTKRQSELKTEIQKLKREKAAQKEKPKTQPVQNTYYGTLSQKPPSNKKSNIKRKCPKCNTEASKGDIFCQTCGTKL